MIEYLKIYLILYGWSVLCCTNKQEKNPYQYIVACCSIIVTLFAFAIFQNLQNGIFIIYSVGLIGVIYAIKKAIYDVESRGALLHRIVVLVIIFLLAHSASWGADYWTWDEFSHWGAQIEYLTLKGNLHTDAKLLLFPEYIPGLSLWRYFGHSVLVKTGASGTYFINFLLIFLSIYGITYYKSIGKNIFKFIIVFLGLLIFFQSLVSTLYADPVQSILILCALKIASEKNSTNFIYLVLVTAAVLLSKHVGLIFSLYIVCYYAVVQIFVHKVPWRSVILRFIIIFSAFILLYFAWSKYLTYYSLSKNVIDTSSLTKGGLQDVFAIMKTHIAGVLDNRYPHASYMPTALDLGFVAHGISLGILSLFILVFSAAFMLLQNENKRLISINFISTAIVSLSFLIFLAFVRVATPGLTGDIYSFTRYFVVILYPFIFLQLLSTLDFSLKRSFLIGLTIFAAYLAVAPTFNSTLSYKKRDLLGITVEYKAKAAIAKKYAKENSIIWYVNSEESPAYFMFRARVLPVEVKGYWNGTGLYLYDSLKTTKDVDTRIDKFSRLMCDVDLIYVDTVPDEFWVQYTGLFDKTKGQIYRVKPGLDGHCTATYLE
jgi:hypothetical protein